MKVLAIHVKITKSNSAAWMQKPPVRAWTCTHPRIDPRRAGQDVCTTACTSFFLQCLEKGPGAQNLTCYVQWLPMILGYCGSGCKWVLQSLHPVGFIRADKATYLFELRCCLCLGSPSAVRDSWLREEPPATRVCCGGKSIWWRPISWWGHTCIWRLLGCWSKHQMCKCVSCF